MDKPKSLSKEEAFQHYEDSMSEADKIAYNIAKKQLESSFDLEKSIGFLAYLKKANIMINEK